MSGSDATVIAALVAALGAIGSVVYTRHQARLDEAEANRRRNDPELQTLERKAYERARASYEAALRVAQAESRRLESRVQACERAAEQAHLAARNAVARAEAAEDAARRQGRTLQALRRWLRQNGTQIPAHLDGDDEETT